MSNKDIPIHLLLASAMKVDANVQEQQNAKDRDEFLTRIGVGSLPAPSHAPVAQAPSLPQPVAAAIAALSGEGAAMLGDEPLAALYPNDEEDQSNVTDQNRQLQGQSLGNDHPVESVAKQGEPVQVLDQGQARQAVSEEDGAAALAALLTPAPAPVVAPPVVAAPAVAPSPWETPATETKPAAAKPATKSTKK